jgi:hypothetical protein
MIRLPPIDQRAGPSGSASVFDPSDQITESCASAREIYISSCLDHASEIADDTETHLARLWNVPLTMPAVNWLDGFKAIAQARHAKELETGVSDYEARVVRKIGTKRAVHRHLQRL